MLDAVVADVDKPDVDIVRDVEVSPTLNVTDVVNLCPSVENDFDLFDTSHIL